MAYSRLANMKHGYTNETRHFGDTVRKTYQGPDAAERQAAEHRALTRVGGSMPVPAVIASGQGWLELEFMHGQHGQELLDAGCAIAVLRECGRTLRLIHELDPRLIDPAATGAVVIQHGDFGPNNTLFDTDHRLVAVLDWEFSAIGAQITDVAWCEWIVRMHHPGAVDALPHFFAAYGSTPPWPHRKAEMLRRCQWLAEFTTRWDPKGPGVGVWHERARVVESWHE